MKIGLKLKLVGILIMVVSPFIGIFSKNLILGAILFFIGFFVAVAGRSQDLG